MKGIAFHFKYLLGYPCLPQDDGQHWHPNQFGKVCSWSCDLSSGSAGGLLSSNGETGSLNRVELLHHHIQHTSVLILAPLWNSSDIKEGKYLNIYSLFWIWNIKTPLNYRFNEITIYTPCSLEDNNKPGLIQKIVNINKELWDNNYFGMVF